MKVIFLKSCPPYRQGEVQTVAAGHALNFLFPKGIAKVATPQAIAAAEKTEKELKRHASQAVTQTNAALTKLQGLTVAIPARAAASGTLYAALTVKQLAVALSEVLGFPLAEVFCKQLSAIKHTGLHQITLQHQQQTATFTIKV